MIDFLKFGIPTLMLVVGAIACLRELLFFWFAEEAEGEVIGFHEYIDSDGDKMWQAEIRWQCQDQSREFRDPMGFGWRAFKLGDRVRLLHPHAKPDHVRVRRSGPGLIFLAIALAGAAALALSLSGA